MYYISIQVGLGDTFVKKKEIYILKCVTTSPIKIKIE